MTVAERANSNKVDVNVTMGGISGFTQNLRVPFDPAAQLNIGDVLIFPEKITADIMGVRKFNGKEYEFMVITIKKADGTETAINWFPTTFTKVVFVWKADDKGILSRTGEILPMKGTAVDAFLSMRGKAEFDANNNLVKSDTQACVEQLLGKKVKISNKELHKTVGFKDNKQDLSQLVDAAVITYDFV